MFGQIGVVGCGLIGGSLIKALRARTQRDAPATRVVGIDRADVLDRARAYLDEGAETATAQASELVARSDLVVLAAPVGAIAAGLPWALDVAGRNAVVTDTGSVKRPILDAVAAHPRRSRFVGGHPMTGRETGGFDASTPDLFEGARWYLVTGESTGVDPGAAGRVSALARAVGAEPVPIGAAEHDRAMAYVSHAPQLVASAIYAAAADAGVIGEAGPGFRDVTRIAGGPASIWRDIVAANRDRLALALREILSPLEEIERRLAAGDDRAIADAAALLERARLARDIGGGDVGSREGRAPGKAAS